MTSPKNTKTAGITQIKAGANEETPEGVDDGLNQLREDAIRLHHERVTLVQFSHFHGVDLAQVPISQQKYIFKMRQLFTKSYISAALDKNARQTQTLIEDEFFEK